MKPTRLHNSPIIDTHVHLDDLARVTNTTIDSVILDANKVGVDQFIVPGLYPEQWSNILQVSQSHPGSVHCAFGIHPWWVESLIQHGSVKDYRKILAEFVDTHGCIAIGETGLDQLKKAAYNHQLAFFDMHLSIAADTNKPVIIHCVRAHNDLQRLLKKYQGKVRGVIHGFSGSVDLAMDYWKKGFFLGIGGTITYPRANKTRQAVSQLPLESLLLETDAPAMPLFGQQGKANKPEAVLTVVEEIAKLKEHETEIDKNRVIEQAWKNAKRLFGNRIE
jgi:TatD DNase family protein